MEELIDIVDLEGIGLESFLRHERRTLVCIVLPILSGDFDSHLCFYGMLSRIIQLTITGKEAVDLGL